MTIKFLESYRLKIRRLNLIEEELKAVEYNIAGIDPAKAAVQTGKPGDPTAVCALRLIELREKFASEIDRLSSDIKRIQNYIEGIEDDNIKMIAELRFYRGLTYKEIGRRTNYHYSTCIKLLKNYVSQNSQ